MWKVVIVICAVGNPCVMMEEDPMKYYQNKNSCMTVSEAKHTELLEGFAQYGYYVESSSFDCKRVPIQ